MNRRLHDVVAGVLSRKHDDRAKRWSHDVIAFVLTVAPMLVAAAAVAALVALVDWIAPIDWYVWVVVSPLLYLGGLVVFLLISAWICGQAGKRNPKPRYAVMNPGLTRDSAELLGMVTAAMCYRRLAILRSVPLVTLLYQFPAFQSLVLRAYSPSVHIGKSFLNQGLLFDPDLTEIGNNVVLGGEAAIVAHSIAIRSDGALVYASAPVRIGDRVSIGGEARIALGCVLGDDSVVELGAVLEPGTIVPPGEVWGGNPARFRRKRDSVDRVDDAATVAVAPGPVDEAAPSEPARERARRLVVDALRLTPEEGDGELSSETCALWDSLGQISIAAAIFDQYGVAVDGAEIFRLKSLDDIGRVLAGGQSPAQQASTDDGSAAGAPAFEPGSEHAPAPFPDDPEMLPLLGAQAATRALAAAASGAPPDAIALRLDVVASFTAQAVEPPLKLWSRAFGYELDCRFAGYDQIVQFLLEEGSRPGSNGGAVTVVLSRCEDLPPDPPAAAAALDQMLDAIERAAADRAPDRRLLVGTLPPVVSSFGTLQRHEADALRERWRARLAATTGVELFDFARVVERVGVENARSSRSEVLTRGGYSQQLHQELAIALVRSIRTARGRPAKVVALDCDNTLWGGVVGEVGLDGLELGPDGPGRSFQLFQRYLKGLKDRGLLLAVVSRNEESDVRDVFARHPEMVLRAEDIASWHVNWEHKSENLRRLAEELNLGLDSFVFLDDDPATRLEVKTRAPAVHVVPLPEDPAEYCETLDRLWLFDGAPATAVDASRTQKAHEEERRREEQGTAVSLDDFLRSLELEVDLGVAGDSDWPRVAQLTQRTNQFNLSLKRRTLDEVKALGGRANVLVLEARDRFGDFGQVGVCVLEPSAQPDLWELDTLLMSCRALGRGVEDAFLHGIAATAAAQGASALVAPYRRGPRNALIVDFLARSGFEEVEPDLWRRSIEPLPPLPGHVSFRVVTTGSASAEPAAPAVPPPIVVFEDEDVSLFSAASHDRNPLHLSEAYARKTAYGQPVVFGVLGVLAALRHLADGPKGAVRSVEVEFRQPLFAGVPYRVETRATANGAEQLVLRDGGRLVLQLAVTREPAAREPADVAPVEAITRAEPAELALEELEPGLAVRGAYAPSEAAFAQLLDRWELGGKGLGRDRLAALLWSSYLVGMELPGKRALFWSLDLRFRHDVPGSTSFSYVATVDRADEQMEFVDVTADLTCGETPWAQAKVRAFVRRELPSPAPTARLSPGPGSDARRGTVAVVIGGSRGLGAALVQNLVMEGCTVLATYWQSADDAERLALGLSEAPGTVEFLQGDAGDEAWCRDVLGSRVAEHSRLDLLVCNAAPALRPLGLDPEGLERFQDFTTTSLRLVASPLAALIEPLSERSGTCVLVSSSALREPPADWPHYVTAKSAAEGLIGWAATKYPRVRFLVARPPRMRTAMTNSPGAHWNAVAAESVAHTILQQLSGPAGGGVELLETFVSPRATADG